MQVVEHMKSLALACLENGSYLEAELFLKQCIQMREHVASATGLELAGYFDLLAFCYQKQGDYLAAERLYKRALMIRRKIKIFLNPSIETIEENYKSLLALKH